MALRLWRPLHEMNQGAFWWGGRPADTKRLWQISYNYMKNTKGLTNLVWGWDVQDSTTDLAGVVRDYNPGSQYWDVALLDVYDGRGYTQQNYEMSLVESRLPLANATFPLPLLNWRLSQCGHSS